MRIKLKFLNVLCFLFALGMPFYDSWEIAGHQIGDSHQITLGLLALYFFLGSAFIKLNPGRRVRLTYSKFFFIFTLLIILSLIFGGGEMTDLGIRHATFYGELAIMYFILSEIVFDPSTILFCYYGLLAGFLVSVFIGFMQFLRIPGFELFSEDVLNGNTAYVSQSEAIDVLRVWGPFGNALTFSFYLSVTGTLLFYFFRFVKKSHFAAWTLFILTVVCISMTVSRMALLAFLFSSWLVLFFSVKGRKRAWLLLLTCFIIIGVTTYVKEASPENAMISRVNASEDDFKGGRLGLWEVGYKVWMQNILFGAGPGQLNAELYKNGWKTVGKDVVDKTPGHVENYYLTLLFTFGLVPFVFYWLFLVRYVQASYLLLKGGIKDPEWLVATPIFGALVCLLINNLVNPALNTDIRIQVLLILQMAICNNLYKRFAMGTQEKVESFFPLNPTAA